MTQKFETIGQCIDWLNTEEGRNDSFTLFDDKGHFSTFKRVGDHLKFEDHDADRNYLFDSNFIKIVHNPYQPPYEWDYLQALTAIEKGDVEAVECKMNYAVPSYLALNENGNFCWYDTKGNYQLNQLFISKAIRELKFRPYTPKKEG